MTLILATVLNGSAILAADRRITLTDGEDNFVGYGEGDKLFCVAGCICATHGGNPPNFNVPDFIRSFQQSPLSAAALSQQIYDGILAIEHRGNFGVIIMGEGENETELWEISPQDDFRQIILGAGQLCQRPEFVQIQGESPFQDIAIAESQMLSIFRQVSQLTENVGPPFELSIFSNGNPQLVKRYCS